MLLQVTGELLAADGTIVARSVRTWVPRKAHPLIKLLTGVINLPLVTPPALLPPTPNPPSS
jgi:hypothetical protein